MLVSNISNVSCNGFSDGFATVSVSGGTAPYTYSWDKKRWERLRDEGWIEVWRHRNRTSIKYSIFTNLI